MWVAYETQLFFYKNRIQLAGPTKFNGSCHPFLVSFLSPFSVVLNGSSIDQIMKFCASYLHITKSICGIYAKLLKTLNYL